MAILAKEKLDVLEIKEFIDDKDDGVLDAGWIELNTRRGQFIIGAVYIPHPSEKRNQHIVDEIFQKLQAQTEQIKEIGKPIVILGDLDAHMDGESKEWERGGVQPNAAGKLVTEFIKQNEMVILNHENICYGKWTREENDTRSVTDYILCSGQLLNRLEKMVVDEEGSCIYNQLYCDIDLNLNRYIGRPV